MRMLAVCVVLLGALSSWGLCAPITGHVLGPDGQPFAGASVWLSTLDISAGSASRPQVVGVTKTAADGSFTLPQPDTPATMTQVIVHSPDLALGWKSVTAETADIEIRLQRPGLLSGVVIGDDGNPLPGALVTPNGAYAFTSATGAAPDFVMLPDAVASELAAHTDASGAYTLTVFPDGAMPMFTVSAEGLGSLNVGGPQIPPKITLGRPGGIKGRILCPEDPQACAGAQVIVSSTGGFGGLPPAPVLTDASGVFTVERLQPGAYMTQVIPAAPGYLQSEEGLVEIISGQQVEVEITLAKGAPIRGRVVMEETAEPVAGAQVTVYPSEGGFGAMMSSTGTDGRFEAYALPGDVTIQVSRPDEEGWGGAMGIEPTTAAVPAEGIDVGEIKLPRIYTVTVKVVDETGAPISGVSVVARREYNTKMPEATDSDGATEVSGLTAGEYTVRATKENAASELTTVAVGPDMGPVTLTLKPAMLGSVTAKLLDQDESPVADAKVAVQPDWNAYYESIGPDALEEAPPDLSLESAQPDADGVVRITGLEPGWTYSLLIFAPGSFAVTSDSWKVEGGVTHDLGVIRIERPRGEVSGVIVDGAGAPISGAKVVDLLDAPQRLEATTDEAGRFTIKGLIEGEVFLLVEAPGAAIAGAPVKTGTADLRVTLCPRPVGAMGAPPGPVQPAQSREEREKLTRDLLVWAVEQMPAATEAEEQPGMGAEPLLSLLARIDPTMAFQLAAEKGVPDAGLKSEVGLAHLEDDFDEALGLIREGLEPSYAAYTLLGEARSRAQSNPQLAARCAEAALDMVPLLADATTQISTKAECAALLRESDPERAARLLAEAQADAEKLGTEDQQASARVEVAKALAASDPEEALGLIEPLKTPPAPEEGEVTPEPGAVSYAYREAITGIACRIAGTDPDRALELIKSLPAEEYGNPNQSLALVLGFFPRDQFDRALELANGIETPQARALALARLCSIAPTERAPELIEEAEAMMASASDGSPAADGDSLASLALLARRLGYQPYEQIALRALLTIGSLPPGMEGMGPMPGGFGADKLNSLGPKLLLVTPELGRRVLASPVVIASGERYPGASGGVSSMFSPGSEVAVEDPAKAIEQARQLPAGYERDFAIYQLAQELLKDPLERETEALAGPSTAPLLPVLDTGAVG